MQQCKGERNECICVSWFSCLVCDMSPSLPQAAVSMLKQDYKEGEMSLSSALALAVKVLNKTMDVSKLSAEKGEPRKHFLVLLAYYDLFPVK